MARRIVDISVPLESGIRSDPPFMQPEIQYKGTSKNDAAGVNPDVPCGLPDSGQV